MDLKEKLPTLDFISSSYFLPIFKALAGAKRTISVVKAPKEDSILLDSHTAFPNSGTPESQFTRLILQVRIALTSSRPPSFILRDLCSPFSTAPRLLMMR